MLNLRRGPGAYALLSRADGQLTRAGQHYYLGLRPPRAEDFDYNQPLIREGPNDYILLQRAEEARALPAGRRAPADQAGQGLLPRQVLRVPGPRAGDHPWQAAQRAERRRGLRAQGLAGERAGGPRGTRRTSEEQVAQRVRQQVEAPSCSSRTRPTSSTLRGTGWSAPRARATGTRTEVETLLRQRMRGLRSVSFQLPCEEDVLPSAFEDKPLCVPWQLAELLQLSVEEVCADFDAMLRHDWRRLGISAEEVREFCVWRNAPMRVLSSQGDLVDSYDPALKEQRALLHVQGREEGAGAAGGARALPGRGEADPAAHPRVEALRRRGRAAGAVLVRGPAGGAAPAHGCRREPQDGHQQPGAVLRTEAEAGHEVVRGAQPGVQGPAPGRLGARDFLEAAAKREVPGAAERQKTATARRR